MERGERNGRLYTIVFEAISRVVEKQLDNLDMRY